MYGVCMIQCSGRRFEGSIVGSRGDNGSKLLSIDIVDGYINQIKSIKRRLRGQKHILFVVGRSGRWYTHSYSAWAMRHSLGSHMTRARDCRICFYYCIVI